MLLDCARSDTGIVWALGEGTARKLPAGLAFVFGLGRVGDDVELAAHAGAEPVAVVFFDFGGGEVGGEVRGAAVGHKILVAGE